MQIGVLAKKEKQNADSWDPDETAHNEPSHLNLHGLNIYMFWSAGFKGIK